MHLAPEERAKRDVGYRSVDAFVRDGTCVGLGTGSTAKWAVERIGELVASGWHVRAVATSRETEVLCHERRIPLVALADEAIDVAIDGADEAAPDRSLVKGGGGALFREKAVALAAATFVAIVTDRKVVPVLGAFPLPIEIVPFSLTMVKRAIERTYAIETTVRERDGAPYVSDNGNAILDCRFGAISDPGELDRALQALYGVVTTGLFVGLAARVLVANVDGSMSEF